VIPSQLSDHLLAVFGLWLVWSVADVWLTAPRWAWYLALAAVSFPIEWRIGDHWWLGPGLAGATAVLMLVTDLLSVATDSAKVAVLRNARK
jgi:hypothetical protein